MHPIFFHIGDFVIGTYGVMIVIGLLSGLGLISRLARRRNLNPDFFYDLVFLVMLTGFLGARLFYIGQNWQDFMANPRAMILSREGFVFLGGFITAVGVAIVFSRRRRMPLLEVADIAAPGLVLGHAFGRIGCFFAGCCHGFACPPDSAHFLLRHFAVTYPVLRAPDGTLNQMFNYAYSSQVEQGLLSPAAAQTLPLIPVQLFESFGNFMICLVLLWFWKRRAFSGQIAALYLMLYSVLRFNLEFLRGDEIRGLYFNGAISTSQIISIGTLLAGLALYLWRKDRGVGAISPEALASPAAAPAADKRAAKVRKPGGSSAPQA